MPYAAEFLASQARAADQLIVDRHRDDPVLVLINRATSAMMRAGRPMLLVSPGKKTRIAFDRILIVWKDTTEARRAVSVALPLLKRTKDVTIVEIVVEGNDALLTWIKQPMPRCG